MNDLLAYTQESSSDNFFSTIWWVIGVVGLWKMFEKANQPGWAGIIPFYKTYKLCEVTMGDPWYWLRLFIPIYNIYVWYVISKATAKAYGQPESWAWGYFFLSNVFYCVTGFGQYNYYGVMGTGDTRTGEARAAKTVNFDVTKNVEPVVTPVEPVVTPVEPKAEESDVDFSFDQNENVE